MGYSVDYYCGDYLFLTLSTPGKLHSIQRLPWIFLPLQKPAWLPQPHRDGPAEEAGAGGDHEHRVHGLGQEH